MRKPRHALCAGLLALVVAWAFDVLAVEAHPLAGEHESPAAVQVIPVAPPVMPEPLDPRSPSTMAVALLALLALAGGGVGGRPRRALAGFMGLLIVAAIVETAVHSVHHLGTSNDGARCSVSSVGQHLHGDVSSEPPSGAPSADFLPYGVPALSADAGPGPVRGADESRAPPFLSA